MLILLELAWYWRLFLHNHKNCHSLPEADACFLPKGSIGWHQHVTPSLSLRLCLCVSVSLSPWDLVCGTATLKFFFFVFFFWFPAHIFLPGTLKVHQVEARLVPSVAALVGRARQLAWLLHRFHHTFPTLLQYCALTFSSITQQYLCKTSLGET